MSNKNITSIVTPDHHVNVKWSYFDTKKWVEFNGICLKQDKISYNHRKIANIYIVYELSKNYEISSYPALERCLFGVVSLTKNKCKYSGYGIGFDRKWFFSLSDGHLKNVIIFGVDLTSSPLIDNKKKYLNSW